MGIWGLAPLENDAALDWLQTLLEDGGLAAFIEASINLDIHESPHEVRAAAHLFHTLDKAGFWPNDWRKQFAELAASRLERILSDRVITNTCIVVEIRKEINTLHSFDSTRPSPLHGPNTAGHQP